MNRETLKSKIIEIIGGRISPELAEIKAMLIMDECEKYYAETVGQISIGEVISEKKHAPIFDEMFGVKVSDKVWPTNKTDKTWMERITEMGFDPNKTEKHHGC